MDVYPGTTRGNPKMHPDQVFKLREDFWLDRIVLMGERGMLPQAQTEYLKKYSAVS